MDARLFDRVTNSFSIYFRSEVMNLYQIQMPKDDAQTVMNDIGDIGLAHFIDLNADESPYTLPYTA